ncbi:hypothetical protein Pelo_6526 [Pelomyxa schiedti]|nr:hypothetical protein Pelo_6526 [Pelomyxa schiedti]
MFCCTVVSIGATLGVISTVDTDGEWDADRYIGCWLGCDRLLTYHWEVRDRIVQVVDVARGMATTHNALLESATTTSGCTLFWGTHKWVDVVFSRTEPSLIEDGDEASVLVLFENDSRRFMVLTVDLEKSFSTSSLVVVKGKECYTTPKGSSIRPYLFMDVSGKNMKVVYTIPNSGYLTVFSLPLKKGGKMTKLHDSCRYVSKEGDNLIGLDFDCHDIFRFQPHVFVCKLVGPHPLLRRGLTVNVFPCTTTTGAMLRTVNDTQTGLTLCRCQVQFSTFFF